MESTEIESLLKENIRLTEKNTAELARMRKELFWMSILRIMVWLVLAGVPIFVYLHVVKPPLEGVFGSYSSMFDAR